MEASAAVALQRSSRSPSVSPPSSHVALHESYHGSSRYSSPPHHRDSRLANSHNPNQRAQQQSTHDQTGPANSGHSGRRQPYSPGAFMAAKLFKGNQDLGTKSPVMIVSPSKKHALSKAAHSTASEKVVERSTRKSESHHHRRSRCLDHPDSKVSIPQQSPEGMTDGVRELTHTDGNSDRIAAKQGKDRLHRRSSDRRPKQERDPADSVRLTESSNGRVQFDEATLLVSTGTSTEEALSPTFSSDHSNLKHQRHVSHSHNQPGSGDVRGGHAIPVGSSTTPPPGAVAGFSNGPTTPSESDIVYMSVPQLASLTSIDIDKLASFWAVFTKQKNDIRNGERLEYLSWRLWFRQRSKQLELARTARGSRESLQKCNLTAVRRSSESIDNASEFAKAAEGAHLVDTMAMAAQASPLNISPISLRSPASSFNASANIPKRASHAGAKKSIGFPGVSTISTQTTSAIVPATARSCSIGSTSRREHTRSRDKLSTSGKSEDARSGQSSKHSRRSPGSSRSNSYSMAVDGRNPGRIVPDQRMPTLHTANATTSTATLELIHPSNSSSITASSADSGSWMKRSSRVYDFKSLAALPIPVPASANTGGIAKEMRKQEVRDRRQKQKDRVEKVVRRKWTSQVGPEVEHDNEALKEEMGKTRGHLTAAQRSTSRTSLKDLGHSHAPSQASHLSKGLGTKPSVTSNLSALQGVPNKKTTLAVPRDKLDEMIDDRGEVTFFVSSFKESPRFR